MPVFTPNFTLPVPGPLDEPCEFAQQWCGFSDAVQGVLDGFEAVADRTNPVVPVAKMETLVPVVLLQDSLLPFDTLTLDNADMVDFDANNTTITIKRPGRFHAVLNITFATQNATLFPFRAIINPAGAATVARLIGINGVPDLDFVTSPALCATHVFYVTTPNLNVSVSVSGGNGGATLTINQAALSLFWFADRATP